MTDDYIRIDESYYKKVKNSFFYTKKFGSRFETKNFNFNSHNYDLKVEKIKFASPGVTDFIGAAKIIETLFELIKYYFPNKEGKLKRRIMEEDLISKKIENLNKIRYSSVEIEKYETLKNTAISEIRGLKYEEKITNIKIKHKN